jgi:ketosteroid isomerase-like protein
MSQNVEIVRAGLDAFDRGEWDAAVQHAAPDVELDMSRAIGFPPDVYGREQLRTVFSEMREAWESVRTEPHEFIEVDEHVIVPVTVHMVGRQGIEVEARTTWMWTFRDGIVVRLALFQERRDALEAVGLSDESEPAAPDVQE